MDQPARRRLATMIGGYAASQAIYVVARLGIADQLRDGPRTAGELARSTGTHAGSLHRLLRTLASLGVFAADDAGRFRLTELAELLCRDVPGSLRAEAVTVGELHYAAFGELLDSVRTGRPGFDAAFGMPLFDYLAANPEAARTFDAGLAGLRVQATAAMLDAVRLFGRPETGGRGRRHGRPAGGGPGEIPRDEGHPVRPAPRHRTGEGPSRRGRGSLHAGRW